MKTSRRCPKLFSKGMCAPATVVIALAVNAFAAEPTLVDGSTLTPPLPKSKFWVPLVTNCDALNRFVRGETEPATLAIPPGQIVCNGWNYTNVDHCSGDPRIAGDGDRWAAPASFIKLASFLETNATLGLHILARPDQVQEDVEAIQVVPNVPFNPQFPFLATFILPPKFNKTNKYPIVISGNWYSESNNVRIFHTDSDTRLPGSDDYLVAVGCALQGRKGVIIVTLNCGGYESFGIQKESFSTVADIIDSTVAMFSGDNTKVMFWGRSRGGLTALAWGSNPLGREYKTIGIFSQSSFPALGTVMTWHTNVLNGFWFAFDKVYGASDILNMPVFNGTDFIMRTTGYTTLAECDANCGLALIPELKAMKSVAHVTTSVGTKDCWQPYYLGQMYHDALARDSIHVRSYFQLGGGHEANIYQVMEDLVNFAGCVTHDSTPEVCAARPELAPLKMYSRYINPDQGVYGNIKKINIPDTSCIPVSVRFPKRMIKGQLSMLEIVGSEKRQVKVTLVDSSGTPLIAIDTTIPSTRYILHPFTIDSTGNYTWTVVVDPNDTLTFTPFNNQALITEARDNVNPSGGYNSSDLNYDRGFGVDEVRDSTPYVCPEQSPIRDTRDSRRYDPVPALSAWLAPGKNLLCIRAELPSMERIESIGLYALTGRCVSMRKDFNVRNDNGALEIEAALSSKLAAGTYMVQLSAEGVTYRRALTGAH